MKPRKNSLSSFILLSLEKAIDGYVRLEDYLYHLGSYLHGDRWNFSLKKSTLAEAIRRLREADLIEKDVNEGKVILRLTNLGKEFVGKDKYVWDGKWRIVIFDIPESKRTVRNLLRRRLQDWNFKIWQKSVWVSKRNITNKLRKLISELGIEKWVAIIESNDPALVHIILDDRPTKYE